MRRREFLAKTAAVAGAAGLASAWPVDALVHHAGRVQTATPFPSPSNMPIDTFVVLMMENRSFDHYFGWHPNADGRNAGLSYPDDNGITHPTHSLAPDFQGCAFADPDHSWDGGRRQFDGGKLDGFRQGNARDRNDDYAIGYYEKADLPFIPTRRTPSPSTTATSARSWTRPSPTASTCTPPPPAGTRRMPPRAT